MKIKFIIAIILLLVASLFLAYSYYIYQLSPINEDDSVIKIEIPKNTSGTKIAKLLLANNLIRSEAIFKIYLKLNNVNNLKHGIYDLKQTMDVEEIVAIIQKGTNLTGNEIDILFREGINMRNVARVIGSKTNNTEEAVFNLLNDTAYIDTLIAEYWFLTDEIKNAHIYYPLEGYLAPNTYRFNNEDVSVDVIFRRMLRETDRILSKYKDHLNNINFTIHEFMTMASIVESEGVNDIDRPKIAGVFYNRLSRKIPFESCVTACYATKTDACTPRKVNKNYASPYNTYLSSMVGKLPVGPVSIPGKASITATINPAEHNYIFFLADKYNRTYFNETNSQHESTIKELKKAGLWIEN